MAGISRDELESLARQRSRLCISIFLPTHRAGADTRQDPIRLKNLLRETEAQIKSVRKTKAREILAPARELTQRAGFWRTQNEGLAIYLSDGFFRYFKLPLALPERVLVAERFEVKPLLPLFTASGPFYILGISQKRVRFFEGTQFGVSEVDLQNVPQGIQDALKYEVHERQQQVHTASAASVTGARSKEGAVFHGQSVGVDDSKQRMLDYFRQVNRGLKHLLKDRWAPLVLAGVEELFPVYREANTYPHLVHQGVPGNPDGLGADEVHKRAWQTVASYFEQAKRQAISQYQSLIGTPRASNQLPDVLRAAHQGRVEFAFIPPDTERWGRFDPEHDAVDVHVTAEPDDEDLVNAVAIWTIVNHGAVYAIAPQDVPDASPVAAVFRYST
jgi:Bacterial archaeo-eukaryotic release factor family 7